MKGNNRWQRYLDRSPQVTKMVERDKLNLASYLMRTVPGNTLRIRITMI